MKNRNNIGFFALMAVVALAIYALSCRPSWNPEGTKFAYVYYGDNKQGVGIYDTQKNENETLFEHEGDPDKVLISDVFWMKNGKDLLHVTQYNNDDEDTTFSVSKYNLKSKDTQIMTQFKLPASNDTAIRAPVFFENEKYLWIADIKENTNSIVYRVNIKNGKYKSFGDEEMPWYIIGNKNKIFFMKTCEGGEGEYIYGKISRFPWFKQKEMFRLKFEKDTVFMPLMIKPEKKDIFAYMTIVDKKMKLAILDSKGKQIKIIEIKDIVEKDKTNEKFGLTYACEWDKRGKRLWLIGGDNEQGGLFEVDVEKGTSKFIPVHGEKNIPLHLSLSPKEDMLAFSILGDKDGDMKFGLLDLRTDGRKVKFIYPAEYTPEEDKSEEE